MIDTQSYVVTDRYFGAPYVDADEVLDQPLPHRRIHGGFADTDTRFTFCFPLDGQYQGRLYQPLEGGNAGHADVNTGPLGLVTGGLDSCFRLGGYAVESNMGHIGDVEDPKAGPDPTIYGWRAAAESAFAALYAARMSPISSPGMADPRLFALALASRLIPKVAGSATRETRLRRIGSRVSVSMSQSGDT